MNTIGYFEIQSSSPLREVIQVENFDQTSELILQNGGQIAFPKFAIPGRCWQGYFVDEDNNTFGIFEVNENAK